MGFDRGPRRYPNLFRIIKSLISSAWANPSKNIYTIGIIKNDNKTGRIDFKIIKNQPYCFIANLKNYSVKIQPSQSLFLNLSSKNKLNYKGKSIIFYKN